MRVDRLDRIVRLEQVGLARARRAAQNLHAGDRRLVADDHGDAGFQPVVGGIADAQAGDVGDEVARPGAERHWHSTATNFVPSKRKSAVGVFGRGRPCRRS